MIVFALLLSWLAQTSHAVTLVHSNDVLGEITNMLTGHLKSCLCDAGAPCAVSIPSIIRGSSYQVETLPDVRRELLLFHCEADPLAVEVHLKFN